MCLVAVAVALCVTLGALNLAAEEHAVLDAAAPERASGVVSTELKSLVRAVSSDASPADDRSSVEAESSSDANAAANESPPRERQTVSLFPPRLSLGRVYFLPRGSYSSERGLGVGGQVLYPFRWPGSAETTRASELVANGLVTFKGQTRLEVGGTVNWGDGTYYLKTRLRHRDTAERFFGIGPDTQQSDKEVYRPRRLLGYVELFRKFFPSFQAGVRFEAEHYRFVELDVGGQLDQPVFRSTTGKGIVGTGAALEWDTRDQRHSPNRGSYYQAFFLLFDENIGSELNFKNYHIDLRQFFSVRAEHVLATQVFVFGTGDHPPFWRFASLGGRTHTRGYRRDRYLDQLLVATQAEYRFPKWRGLGTTTFVGAATVAPGWATLQLTHLRPTVGVGLNLHYGRNEAIAARFDTAFGDDGFEFQFSLNESF